MPTAVQRDIGPEEFVLTTLGHAYVPRILHLITIHPLPATSRQTSKLYPAIQEIRSGSDGGTSGPRGNPLLCTSNGQSTANSLGHLTYHYTILVCDRYTLISYHTCCKEFLRISVRHIKDDSGNGVVLLLALGSFTEWSLPLGCPMCVAMTLALTKDMLFPLGKELTCPVW